MVRHCPPAQFIAPSFLNRAGRAVSRRRAPLPLRCRTPTISSGLIHCTLRFRTAAIGDRSVLTRAIRAPMESMAAFFRVKKAPPAYRSPASSWRASRATGTPLRLSSSVPIRMRLLSVHQCGRGGSGCRAAWTRCPRGPSPRRRRRRPSICSYWGVQMAKDD
jgi:hypothetical protein